VSQTVKAVARAATWDPKLCRRCTFSHKLPL